MRNLEDNTKSSLKISLFNNKNVSLYYKYEYQ